jgi:hypothetical protein
MGSRPDFDTISAKTDTVIFRNVQNGLRLAGIGMYLAPKYHQIALFGATIAGRMGCSMWKSEKHAFFLKVRVCPTLT